MQGILKKTFQVFKIQWQKFILMSFVFVGLFQAIIQWLSGQMQEAIAGINSSDPFYLIYALMNKLSLNGDVTDPQLANFFGIYAIIMIGSLIYGLIVAPIYSFWVIKTTQEAKPIKEILQTLKGRFGGLVVVTLCYMLVSMALASVLMIVYIIAIIPIMAFAAIATAAPTVGIVGLVVAIIIVLAIIIALALLVSVLSLFVYQSYVIDNVRHFNAVGRSIKMGWQNFWTIVGRYILLGLITVGLVLVLFAVFSLPVIIGGYYSSWLWMVYIALMSTICGPWFIILATLMYQELSSKYPIQPKEKKQVKPLTVESQQQKDY